MRRGPLVVVGDVLLDVDVHGSARRTCPDASAPVVDVASRERRPGGAGLAASIAARANAEVVLVTGVGGQAGADVVRLLGDRVRLAGLPFSGETPGKTRIRSGGRTLLRADSGDGRVLDGPLDPELPGLLRSAGAVLVSDYGRGATANPFLRRALRQLPADVPLVWDPHPRGGVPVGRADLVVPDLAEAVAFTGGSGVDDPALLARALLRRWGCGGVAVTLGAAGAVVVPQAVTGRIPVQPAPPGADACGSGDCFAVITALALADGADPVEAVTEGVRRAGRFVASGGAAQLSEPEPRPGNGGTGTAFEVAERVRRDGGRLVVTGGCFDLLHPGHVRLLERARELGDALVVCLNSDDSVRRIKGAHRPLVGHADRKRLLEALESVTAVVVFDESSPCALLERLRPDVWVKGDDYDVATLPEAEVVHRHGGRTVLVPQIAGYSTSRLLTSLRSAG
ncbi:PfkB family carbohydrate kinase [Saccharopolyspora sp. 6V]|uniref:PfkB family carbohydrate kinase n=1 Tax=Saccharopolyspora sp. 6V TaxID=2877239 RepID=UPI001CD55789|nr:PfkB family carbohydrate kinase [Saccharopolyspora sp. 6V]MCA1192143.1 PfkB family carbohydrate kinase [Saccharopolyspora sp. 6V]